MREPLVLRESFEVASYPTASMNVDDKVLMVMKVTSDGNVNAAAPRNAALSS
jgi:hypothetical protein